MIRKCILRLGGVRYYQAGTVNFGARMAINEDGDAKAVYFDDATGFFWASPWDSWERYLDDPSLEYSEWCARSEGTQLTDDDDGVLMEVIV